MQREEDSGDDKNLNGPVLDVLYDYCRGHPIPHMKDLGATEFYVI